MGGLATNQVNLSEFELTYGILWAMVFVVEVNQEILKV
jgi:hypothetical protein